MKQQAKETPTDYRQLFQILFTLHLLCRYISQEFELYRYLVKRSLTLENHYSLMETNSGLTSEYLAGNFFSIFVLID